MEKNNEIKMANRKALPKFILIMIIACIIGGGIGFFSAKYGVDSLSGVIKTGAGFFGIHIAPWIMLALAIIMPLVSVPLYKKANKLLSAWDGEDEEVYDAADEKLCIAMWIADAALILSYFLIAASYSGGFSIFQNEKNIIPFFISIVSFLGVMVEAILIQQKCVDATKKANPEKTASVYDMKFQKKWVDSCDEAEKILIGKCAYKAYGATNIICSSLAIVLAVSALIFGIGFLPSLVVCAIWFVNHAAYCREAFKYSKSGKEVR